MTQYNSKNLKSLNSQLDNFQSATKNSTALR